MSVLYRFNGQAAYEVDTGRLKGPQGHAQILITGGGL
jgi:hypothetical protein